MQHQNSIINSKHVTLLMIFLKWSDPTPQPREYYLSISVSSNKMNKIQT